MTTPKKKKKKDPGAAAMGKKRWQGVSTAERTRLGRAAAQIRWKKGGSR